MTYPWLDVDSRCPLDADGDTVDDEYCWGGNTVPDPVIAVHPWALDGSCDSDDCKFCCNVWLVNGTAVVRLELDDGEFSPDVDGIDDGS